MGFSTDLKLFESYLSPVLKTAYGTALYLTQNNVAAENLVEQASLHAYSTFSTLSPDVPFKVWFLHILTDLFFKSSQGGGQEAELARWEAEADAYLAQQACLEGAGTAEALSHLSREAILEGFATLPTEYRPLCALYFLDDWSYKEIAQIVDCPVEMVRIRLHRGRRWLQYRLQSSGTPFADNACLRRGVPSSSLNTRQRMSNGGPATLLLL